MRLHGMRWSFILEGKGVLQDYLGNGVLSQVPVYHHREIGSTQTEANWLCGEHLSDRAKYTSFVFCSRSKGIVKGRKLREISEFRQVMFGCIDTAR